jgi:hypothetical protein
MPRGIAAYGSYGGYTEQTDAEQHCPEWHASPNVHQPSQHRTGFQKTRHDICDARLCALIGLEKVAEIRG